MKRYVVRLDKIKDSKIEMICPWTETDNKKKIEENFSFNVEQDSERTFTITIERQGQSKQNQPKIEVMQSAHERSVKNQPNRMKTNQVKGGKSNGIKTVALVSVKNGDIVFAKVKGYAFWPALVDEVASQVKVIFFGPEKSW